MTGPIVVTGADRSGTSLMFALLSSHPDVAMTRRANLWRWFDGRYGDLGSDENLDRLLDDLERYRRLDVLEIERDRVRREFRSGPSTYGRLFSLIFSHFADRTGKARWGDKSLHTEHHADRVFDEWPDARMIQMVRDPRDRHASVSRRYADAEKGIGAITGRWMASARRASRNLDRYPDRYRVIRYETLASEPDGTMREVCEFLSLPFDPEMMAMRAVDEQAQRGGNSSFGSLPPGTISTQSIGRFRAVLSPRETAFIELVAGRRMRRLGYEPSDERLAEHRTRFYLVDLPRDIARMTAWMALDARLDGGSAPESRMSEPSSR